MKEEKIKYQQNDLRLWLVRLVMFFSVFAFSGFNEKIQSAFHETDKTELVEKTKDRSIFNLNHPSHTQLNIPFTKGLNNWSVVNAFALHHFQNLVIIKYKAALKLTLAYKISFIKLPIKRLLPSSSDEFSSFIF